MQSLQCHCSVAAFSLLLPLLHSAVLMQNLQLHCKFQGVPEQNPEGRLLNICIFLRSCYRSVTGHPRTSVPDLNQRVVLEVIRDVMGNPSRCTSCSMGFKKVSDVVGKVL